MSAAVLISMAEYLDTSYSPDREYVDGAVVERHMGELPHSLAQMNLIRFLCLMYPHLLALPEQRMRTIPGVRSRIPDVCVLLTRPTTDVLEAPPLICIEILSRRDEMTDVLEKLQEYVVFGVPYVWLVDPRRKKAYTFDGARLEEAQALVTTEPEIQVPLEEIFRGL